SGRAVRRRADLRGRCPAGDVPELGGADRQQAGRRQLISPQAYKWFFEPTTAVEGHMHAIKRTIVELQTKFQHAEIMETAAYGKLLVLDGRIQSSQAEDFIYHEALVHPGMLACDHAPESGLVIGGGEGATLREILRYPSVRRGVMVDIDGEVVELCKKHLPEMHQGIFEDPRADVRHDLGVHHRHQEGRSPNPESADDRQAHLRAAPRLGPRLLGRIDTPARVQHPQAHPGGDRRPDARHHRRSSADRHLEHGGLEVPHAPVSGAARLILASASPRRRELLASLGLTFEVVPSDADETLEPIALPEAVAALALRKARAVAAARRGGLIIAAD